MPRTFSSRHPEGYGTDDTPADRLTTAREGVVKALEDVVACDEMPCPAHKDKAQDALKEYHDATN